MAPNPVALMRELARGIAATGAPGDALYMLALLGVALARQASPQVSAGQMGWLRSLPASADDRRRATTAALVLVQAPALAFALCCALGVALTPGLRLSAVKLLAIAPIAVAAAMTVAATRRRAWVALACAAAVGLAVGGGVPGLVASIIPLVAADRLAGIAPRRGHRRRWSRQRHLERYLAWRAVSWRVVSTLLTSALPLAAAWFYTVNNDLTAGGAASAVRLCGGIAELIVLAGLADALALRRPVWGWARSLPWSSARRVRHDAALLLAALVPVVIVAGVIDVRGALLLAAATPLLCLVAAGAVRRAGTRLTAASGEIVLVGGLVVAALAVSPWMIVPCLLATPIADRMATRREQVRPVSRWLELHHRPEGDGLWWSAP